MGGGGVMGYWDVGNIVGYVKKGAKTSGEKTDKQIIE